ncbi:hypothetical protein ACWDHW_08050 [Streptomyces melanosporofaciens]
MSVEPAPFSCGAELNHSHGASVCDLPEGHEEQHSGWCNICLENDQDDPSDRLNWERDGEDWLVKR